MKFSLFALMCLSLTGCAVEDSMSHPMTLPQTPQEGASVPILYQRPNGVAVHVDPAFNAEYKRLAYKLGVQQNDGPVLLELMDQFLAERCIPIYNYDEVYIYLTGLAEKERFVTGNTKLRWGWTPLRDKDRKSTMQWTEGKDNDDGRFLDGEWYSRKVPINVLGMVDMLDQRFGDKVTYWVSDYHADTPDPFLMVAGEHAFRIIAVWDEPSFAPHKTISTCDGL